MIYSDPNVNNNAEFWTDANGRQMMRRVRDQRLSFDLVDGDFEPIASNYYPVTSCKSEINHIFKIFYISFDTLQVSEPKLTVIMN